MQARIQERWNGWIFTPHFSEHHSFFFSYPSNIEIIFYFSDWGGENSPPISKSWIRAWDVVILGIGLDWLELAMKAHEVEYHYKEIYVFFHWKILQSQASSVQCRECEDGVLDGNTWEFPKGLGHAMLGNFSTDQMVIELTEIYHNNGAKNCRRSQTKYKKAKKGHWWTKPERVKMDCTWPGFFASLHSWKIILICYTVVTLQITAYYTFRTHN